MTELIKLDTIYAFETKNIRVVGSIDNPKFVVKDICNALGLTNSSETVRNVPIKWRSSKTLMTAAGNEQEMLLVSEPGLYKLIMRSNKPIAQKFQEWVCEEVLPSIRKTGQYNIEQLKKTIEEKEAEIKEIKTELVEEKKIVMKTKKSLMATQRRFTHRHKFRINGCVYVLENPDEKYNKFKIGFSKDMNQRLEDDRTMIPNIKVRMILYTEHYEVFEKCIKIRYKDQLELPSHEWVFEELEKLFETIKELDKVNRFSGILETDAELPTMCIKL